MAPRTPQQNRDVSVRSYAANREVRKAKARERREKYPEEGRTLRAKWRRRAFDAIGHTCARCGFDDKRALQFDHINGGGSKERRQIKSTTAYYRRIIGRGTAEYQTLCANCNWIKRAETDEAKRNSKGEEICTEIEIQLKMFVVSH